MQLTLTEQITLELGKTEVKPWQFRRKWTWHARSLRCTETLQAVPSLWRLITQDNSVKDTVPLDCPGITLSSANLREKINNS